MKGRSSKGASTEAAADDWMNGSWTVDCICGVTFDDGEEMVNCDECGVWVHTRCSRFVKGEPCFACDKCKAKNVHHNPNNNNSTSRTDSEETEVAQLLVELPTKTIKMTGACSSAAANHKNNTSITNVGASSRPYRLWTERPLEERVHVQGIPGGDPCLFEGFPLLFASQLWKCTGYIPKKFNFRYSEFPCWDKLIDVADIDTVANGGGPAALHSLSKPAVAPAAPSANKHNTTLRPFTKRIKEVSGPSKDRPSRKKLKSLHREHDSKRDHKPPAFNTGVLNYTNGRPVQVHEAKATNRASSPCPAETKTKVANDLDNLLPRSSKESTRASSTERIIKLHMPALDSTHQIRTSPNCGSVSLPSPEEDFIAVYPIKKEGLVSAVDKNQEVRSGSPTSTSNLSKSQPIEHAANGALNFTKEFLTNFESVIPLASGKVNGETKSDAELDDSKGILTSHPADADTESDGVEVLTQFVLSPDKKGQNSKLNEPLANIYQSLEQEGQGCDKGLKAGQGCQFDKNDKLADIPCNAEVEYEGSESSMEVLKTSSDLKAVESIEGQMSELSDVILDIPPTPPSHHKTMFVGKSSVSSPAIVFSRSSLSDRSKSCSSHNSSSVGKCLMSNSSVNSRKENAAVNSVKSEEKYERPKNTSNDHPKSCLSSNVKASQPSRTSSGPVLKHYTSVGKDSLRHLSSKVSSVERVESSSLSSRVNDAASGALQDEHAVHGHSRNIASGGQQQGEKVSESNLQPSSNLTQSSVGQPSASTNPSAGLSDEELALLLHQELNSSPRVPRVPRIRQAGCLPQLSSVAATNMLIKRTSGPGGKDQHTFSRRKSKDAPKDGARSTREQDSNARKADKVPSSPALFISSDAKPEGRSDLLHTTKKKGEKTVSSAADSGSLSSDGNEPKSSSLRLEAPEDEIGANKGPAATYLTLPGLIAEIMGKGKRMTYEELCNAVLPHWQNLRKHNGERYAYSSHSQAVLDCLRNRTEWARLVDRGPKTSASRKKRKTDVEPLNTESDDSDDRMLKAGDRKSFESNKEEFPKGRRKARKRRKLALHGRGGKDGQKRQMVESDDSSGDSLSSEDDSQGSEMGTTENEVSASSQEARAVS